MLAGDADRDRAANVLKDAFAEGRLTPEEYDDRVGRAYQARTYTDLDIITADIPRPVPMAPPPPPYYPAPMRAQRTDPKAIASLVCSLVGGCGVGSVAGIVLGHLAKRDIRQTGDHGSGLATAGLIIGYISVVAYMLLGISLFFE